MEILKTDIHMDRVRIEAMSQVALEDDINLPENKPDISFMAFSQGEPVIEEIKTGTDAVTVRGKLVFHSMYYTEEEGGRLVPFEGKVNFDEKIHMEGVTNGDNVQVNIVVEDMTISAIHSRKINVRALMIFRGKACDVKKVELPIEVKDGDIAEFRRMPITVSELVVQKKDVLRVKEEIALPSGYPNIYQILMNKVSLSDFEYRAGEDVFQIQGDINVCVLYEAEGENHGVRTYETTIPLNGKVECQGLSQDMIGDLDIVQGPVKLISKPDADGEERSMDLEMSFDIIMNVYEEGQYEMVSDIYGVTKEVECVTQSENLNTTLNRVGGKTKLSGRMHTKEGQEPVLQVLYYDSKLTPSKEELTDGKIKMQGVLDACVLYVTGNDEKPYEVVKDSLPYEYALDIPDFCSKDSYRTKASVEQLQVNMLDGEELEIKAVLCFQVLTWKENPMELVQGATVKNLDSSKQKGLPGIVIYTVRPGDSLWSIGKRYYVTVNSIKEMNHLTSDMIYPGDKLLISKV